jgi:hypothetical protein
MLQPNGSYGQRKTCDFESLDREEAVVWEGRSRQDSFHIAAEVKFVKSSRVLIFRDVHRGADLARSKFKLDVDVVAVRRLSLSTASSPFNTRKQAYVGLMVDNEEVCAVAF